MAVGVPEIAPFEVEKDRPEGSEGVIDQVVMGPLITVGVTVDMAMF